MTHHDEDKATSQSGWMSRAFTVGLVLLLSGAAYAAVMYRDSIVTRVTRVLAAAEEDPIPVESLKRIAYQLEIPAFGEITGLESVQVSAPQTRSGGLKIAWMIPEGSFIEAGDTVVRFDNTDAQLNMEEEQINLRSNQEQTKITSAKQETEEKVLGMDRTDATLEYEYAMTVLPQDETIFSKWDIIEAKINAGFAKERINFLTNKERVQKRIGRADQQILAIERGKAEMEIEIAQQTLDSLELKSPKGGLVLYRRERGREPQVGDEVWRGQVLIEVVDLAALQARIYVLERDAGNLAKEKEVVIHLDSIHEKDFHGIIRFMTALAQPLDRNSPLKYFTCEVTIHDAGQDLKRIKPGMALKAEVILEKYDACFVVPASAVASKGAENLVYVKEGDGFAPRTVTLGSGTHGQMTILAGVEENELVAMRDPFESRKVHLPDFSKAAARSTPGGPSKSMRIFMH